MTTLVDILGAPRHRAALITEAVSLIEAQVASSRGLKGVGLRAGLAMLKAARPGLLTRAVERLLPDFAQALEPLYRRFRESPTTDFSVFLQQHGTEVVHAAMTTADARVARSSHASLNSGYARLRGAIEAELRAAIPAIGHLLGRHVSQKNGTGPDRAKHARGPGPWE